MLYDIHARIRYDYDQPATAGRNLLRLMPATLPGRQRLMAGRITASPEPAEHAERADFFGNAVTELTFRQSAGSTVFELSARVERIAGDDGGAMLDLSPALSDLAREIATHQSLAPASPHHFLGASSRVAPDAAITAFARDMIEPGMTVLGFARRLGAALHAEMTFDASATTVDTPTPEAFRLRQGVCQDFSHVMIAGLRGCGVPAGYVSGYLRTLPPEGQPRLEGADAMHAWVRLWCGPETGWIEYDPTNDMAAGECHITVAHGRDYDDVSPVQGVLRVAGGQRSLQSVDVAEATASA